MSRWHRPAVRGLTAAERRLAASVFGPGLDLDAVTVRNAKFWLLRPAAVTMAPDGHIWCHPNGVDWCADYAAQPLAMRTHFINEMTHVWQRQQGVNLILRRPPFARYGYTLAPGKPFRRYGIEQQTCIVADAYLLRQGHQLHGKALPAYAAVIPFGRWL